MYIQITVDGKEVLAMMNKGTTSNFVSSKIVEKLGLSMTQVATKIKAVNSATQLVKGFVKITLRVGEWKGKCNMMTVPLDDFTDSWYRILCQSKGVHGTKSE